MRISKEDGKIILEGMEGVAADFAYLCGRSHAYLSEAKRIEKRLKELIRSKEKEDGKKE